MRDERGDMISSWLMQLALVMAVIAFIAYEGLSMVVTAVSLDGDAEQIAEAAAEIMQRGRRTSGDPDDAEEAARTEADERGVEIVEFEIDEDEQLVLLTVTKDAPTLVSQHIPGLRDWTTPSATRRSKWSP